MFHTQTDTGYLVGVIFTIVFMALFWAAGLILWLSKYTGRWASSWAEGLVVWLGGWALCLAGFAIFAFPPLPGAYNEYQPVTGHVQAVSSRFIAGSTQGSGSTQKFAVQLKTTAPGPDGPAGITATYGCNDTRCAVLKRGQPVTLLCEKTFQFNSAEGWDCNFGAYGLNREGS